MSGDHNDEYAVIHSLETELQVANRKIMSLEQELRQLKSLFYSVEYKP